MIDQIVMNASELAKKEWRVEEGDIKGNYRVTVEGRVVAFMIDREIAEQIVREHNALPILKALCLKVSKLDNFGQVYEDGVVAVEDAKAVLSDDNELAKQEFRYEGQTEKEK